jgi:hypothetical protein
MSHRYLNSLRYYIILALKNHFYGCFDTTNLLFWHKNASILEDYIAFPLIEQIIYARYQIKEAHMYFYAVL